MGGDDGLGVSTRGRSGFSGGCTDVNVEGRPGIIWQNPLSRRFAPSPWANDNRKKSEKVIDARPLSAFAGNGLALRLVLMAFKFVRCRWWSLSISMATKSLSVSTLVLLLLLNVDHVASRDRAIYFSRYCGINICAQKSTTRYGRPKITRGRAMIFPWPLEKQLAGKNSPIRHADPCARI